MFLPALLALTAILGLPPAETAFAPAACGFTVTFPAPATVTDSWSADGVHAIAADLVQGGTRFAASCLSVAGAKPVADPAAVTAQIARMAAALGVRNADIRLAANLGAGCEAVTGQLGETAFRIAARLCIADNATFIAEAIFATDRDDPAIGHFLDSIAARPSAAATQ
jgi:hypothetical protein